MEGRAPKEKRRRRGSFRARVAVVFVLQTAVMIIASLMAANNVAPVGAVIAIILCSGGLAWLAVSREWIPVAALARLLDGWDPDRPNMEGLDREGDKRADGDIGSLIRGLHGLATRIEGYGERERNFTRDASHELRSPLTVIKMSSDMLADEAELSEFGHRSLERIRRSTRELEALVEAFLILSRESDQGLAEEDFVVNAVLRQEVDYARELIAGRPVELVLDEPASFALHASPRVFAVLCGQLIRHALQQTDQGTIVVTVMPGSVSVINPALDAPEEGSRRHAAVDRHGFDLAIARRLSDRFQWPLELRALPGASRIASVRFPHPQPVEA
ncbi:MULTISPECIES: HAMP domain-containing sensor histidine kinase [unclassified Luteibacter]|uniref:sensor histidine kinase n=1 Tax=unclassified Luteibacter TaxID=2620188 RepID=UPI0008AF2498|nr:MULTISPECIES: HAMP domain-containing sensor histidine kinase [unclassified Luteibacter]MDR6936524.1 signal transduction histidine kinase [Luteibacter sp. 3190]SEO65052.1 Signal transduction histidine kinase [Luteibacter sp. UNC138MFCol5.1]